MEFSKIVLTQRDYCTDLMLKPVVSQDGAVVYMSTEGQPGVVCIKNVRFQPTERKFIPQEQELHSLFRCYPMALTLKGANKRRVNSVTGVVLDLSIGTHEGSRTLQSRWSKWQMMLLDPCLYVSSRVVKQKHVKQEEEGFEPEATYYTDESKTM